VDFVIADNTVSGVTSTGDFPELALFVGAYSDFGAHSVQNNEFNGAAIQNFGSGTLNADGNTFTQGSQIPESLIPGGIDSGLYYIGPEPGPIASDNTFDETVTVDERDSDSAPVIVSEEAANQQ
jgi:hypothetical protein